MKFIIDPSQDESGSRDSCGGLIVLLQACYLSPHEWHGLYMLPSIQ